MIASTLQLATRSFARNMALSIGNFSAMPCIKSSNVRGIHITSNVMKEFRVGTVKVVRGKVSKEGSIEGEIMDSLPISNTIEKLFPDASTATEIFNGVRYNELHIVNVKATRNNTIISVTNHNGLGIITHSAGCEGFKNTKKGTNIAAQQAATTVGMRAIDKGITTVRVRIQGIGPGRMGSLKGFQVSGLNIVSITDDTRVSWNPPRPRKQRRL